MDPAIKKVAIILAAALIVVIGLIILTADSDKKTAEVATVSSETQIQKAENNVQTNGTQEQNAENKPEDEADTSEVSKTNEALDSDQKIEEAAQDEVMYEGALAGLSEEEIAKMALAEEQGDARGDMTGTESAVD